MPASSPSCFRPCRGSSGHEVEGSHPRWLFPGQMLQDRQQNRVQMSQIVLVDVRDGLSHGVLHGCRSKPGQEAKATGKGQLGSGMGRGWD